jgi:hypothetical protein
MSIKSTQYITRQRALEILTKEISEMSNNTLGELIDTLADSGQSKSLSICDNFIVSDTAVANQLHGDYFDIWFGE